jgi:hypothetical protein
MLGVGCTAHVEPAADALAAGPGWADAALADPTMAPNDATINKRLESSDAVAPRRSRRLPERLFTVILLPRTNTLGVNHISPGWRDAMAAGAGRTAHTTGEGFPGLTLTARNVVLWLSG